jgi:transposase-like protein
MTGQQIGDYHSLLRCRVLQWPENCATSAARKACPVTPWCASRPTSRWAGDRRSCTSVRRYRCTGCGHIWRQDTTIAAASRAKLSRHVVLWALKSVVIDRLSIARVAGGLGVTWHTVNDAVLAAGRELLINDPARLDGVRVIGVDEHAWRHPRRGDKFVTVIIDLTPVRDDVGPARLLDMGEGRSKAVSRPGSRRRSRRSAAGSRWSRCTGSPGSRPPPRSCPRRWR